MEQATKKVKEKPGPSMDTKIKRGSKQNGNTGKKEPGKDKHVTSVNIRAAAVAREVLWRTETDKANKIRLELLEDHVVSSRNTVEEISKDWPHDMQAELVQQQHLYAELIEDKKKIIDSFQQALKAQDDNFVSELKKQKEELQLILEKIEEQDRSFTKAYREELEKWMENIQKKEETTCTEGRTLWKQSIKKHLETEEDKQLKRQQVLEEFGAKLLEMYDAQNIKFDTSDLSVKLEIHQVQSKIISTKQKVKKAKAETHKLKMECSQVQAQVSSLRSEIKNLLDEQSDKIRKKQQLEKRLTHIHRKTQDLQKKILHFAVAEAITFENMWITLDAEVKELLERALYVDSLIHDQILHLHWERPNLSFTETGREQEDACTIFQTSQLSQNEASSSQTDAPNVDVGSEGHNDVTGSKVEVVDTAKDEMMSPRIVKRLMELLCDEAGFLIEVKIVNLLDTLDKNEQILIKTGYLFNALGIDKEDVPKLVEFLYKYDKQRKVHEVDEGETCSTAEATPDPIEDVLHALKCFIDQYKQGSGPKNSDKWSLRIPKAMSNKKGYWESMSKVISADKLRIWEATQSSLEQHHAVLSEISQLNLEIQSLQQENTELQMVCMLSATCVHGPDTVAQPECHSDEHEK